MARVPVIDNMSVLPEAGSSGRFGAAPSTSAAAIPFEQMQQLGRAVQGAGEQASKIAIDAQNEANRVRVLEAVSAAKERALALQLDEKDGYTRQKGSAVLSTNRASGKPLADEYVERYNKELQALEGQFSNSAQVELFREQGLALMTSFRASAMEHEAKEFKTYRMSTIAGGMKAGESNVAANYNKPDVVEKELENVTLLVRALAKEMGTQASEDADAIEARSNLIAAAVDAAFKNGDVSYGVGLYEKHRDKLSGETRLKLDGLVTTKFEEQTAFETVREVMGGIESTAGTALPVRGARPIEGGTVTGKFGDKRSTGVHNGVDLATPAGTALRSQMDGEVIAVWEDGANGKAIRVKYKDGSIHGFAHLSEQGVEKGNKITAGQVLGKTGNTGRSTGPHLHWTVTVDGAKIDPLSWGKGNSERGGSASNYSSLESLIAAAEAKVGDKLTPSLSKRIRAEAQTAWNLREDAIKQSEDDALERAYAELDRNGGNWDKVPAGIKARMNPRDRISAEGTADTIRDRRNEGADTEARLDLLDVLSNPGKVALMDRAEYTRRYKGRLSQAAYEKGYGLLLEAKSSLGGDPSKVTGVLSTEQIIKGAAREVGIIPAEGGKPSESEAAAYDRFQLTINERVEAIEREKGRKANRDEIRAVIDGARADMVYVDEWGRDPQKPIGALTPKQLENSYVMVGDKQVYSRSIPVRDRAQIIEALRLKGRPVNEQTIAELYTRNKR